MGQHLKRTELGFASLNVNMLLRKCCPGAWSVFGVARQQEQESP